MAGKLRPDTSPARSSHSFPRLTRLKNRPGTSEPYVGNRQTKTCTSQSQRQGQRPGIARTQRHDASCSVDTSKESQVLLPAHHRRRHASLPDFWGPDQSQQLRYSKAKPVRDIIERIKQHCPPSHNWEVRRRELQLRIGTCYPVLDPLIAAPEWHAIWWVLCVCRNRILNRNAVQARRPNI
jgi:hypothetical protein